MRFHPRSRHIVMPCFKISVLFFVALSLMAALTGCGHKGPLVVPAEPHAENSQVLQLPANYSKTNATKTNASKTNAAKTEANTAEAAKNLPTTEAK